MGLSDWLEKRAQQKAQKKKALQTRAVLQAHIQNYLYTGNVKSLTGLQQNTKDALVRNLDQMINQVVTAENQFLEIRKVISSLTYPLAAYTVLGLTKEDKASVDDYSNVPWITGELHCHLPALAEHFEELAKDRWESDIADGDLMHWCNNKGATLLFYVNAFNILRLAVFEDKPAGKDWFRPHIVAMMIWWEMIFRSNIEELENHPIHHVMYSKFAGFVEAGADNPLYEFDRMWREFMEEKDEPKPHYLPM